MPDLALLNSELADIRAERELLRQKHPGATMPEEARDRDQALTERTKKVTFLIEEETQNERDRLFDETAKFMDEPQYQINRAVNPDDESRRIMMRAGWEIRGGTIHRQTARGEIAFCPEEVMFGPVPHDDPVAARHFTQMRATMQPEYRNAWRKWLSGKGDERRLNAAEQNALSEGTASEGGYLVPPDIAAEIMSRRADASVMRSLATIRQTSRDRIQFPAVAPNSSSGSVYSSGFVGGVVGERPTNTDAGPTFQQFEIGIKKFEAYTKLTNDLISDSGSDILAFLATDGGRNLGLVEDNEFLTGDGTALHPHGLLNAGITTADVEGTTSDHVSNTVSDAGSAPKIIDLAYLLPEQYEAGASWLMARATKGKVHRLVDGDGRPWWQAAAGAGGQAGAPGDLVEFPVRTSPFVPVGGTNGNKVMVLGDFSAYIIAERTALSVIVDNMNLIGSDETQIFLRSRAGGGVWNVDAFRIGIV